MSAIAARIDINSSTKRQSHAIKNSIRLLDSVAFGHMTFCLIYILFNLVSLVCRIGLLLIENSEGTVGFIIYNILYVPNLACNLIFISQYYIYFSKNKCVIEDHTLKKEIGLSTHT